MNKGWNTINWASCLTDLISKADHCIFECQEKLAPILKRSFPSVEIKAENRNFDLKRKDFDFHLPMGSLYKCFAKKFCKKPKIHVLNS